MTSPRVKAVMTHCSMEGVSAALSEALPIIGVPLRGNQAGVCVLAQNMGAGSCYSSRGASVEEESPEHRFDRMARELTRHIRKVMLDPSTATQYQQQAVRAQRVVQLGGGVARAVDLVEMAMYGGLELLQEPFDRLGLAGWLVRSMVDVRVGVFLLVMLVWWAVVMCCRGMRRLKKKLGCGPDTDDDEEGHEPRDWWSKKDLTPHPRDSKKLR